jgi:CheY-like chemotaxis protein
MGLCAPEGNRLRILVVDDNVDAANALAILLGLWGHIVAVADSGQAGLALAEEFKPQAMLLDIWMPVMHGGELAKHLRATPEFEDALIIAVTAHPPADPRLDNWRHHFDAILGKPCNLTALEDLLAAHVASGR